MLICTCCLCLTDFQELMRNAPEITNCVDACNLEGRQERLDNLLAQLEMCEKALQDYLETKRIAFPRFYFVAPMGEKLLGRTQACVPDALLLCAS